MKFYHSFSGVIREMSVIATPNPVTGSNNIVIEDLNINDNNLVDSNKATLQF